MKLRYCTFALLLIIVPAIGTAQVASHAPTNATQQRAMAAPADGFRVTGKPVARVNGAILTDRDLVRVMLAIFPYAQQHNGFPKEMEPQIRAGAMDMMIFEELVYQDTKRRNITVPAAQLAKAEAAFKNQFSSKEAYAAFLQEETKGDKAALREKIRRSLLIEKQMKAINTRSRVTQAEAKAYYAKNPGKFQREESFHFQSISVLPPNQAPAVVKEAAERAKDLAKRAKETKTYREFGLLAQKESDDDYRVKMGDRKPVARERLPKEVVAVLLKMREGEVSPLIQLGNAYTIVRLIKHVKPGKISFEEAKDQLMLDMQNTRIEATRAALSKKLRSAAKVEKL
ncbi:MAG TPA: peptidyl-prolyl cis-trans isomerase [Terriglobales bacterium]|nr:peptidyl-prolyl cis-trans isomerase [Terriglobales bacterium]